MAEQTAGEKTLPASPKKIQDAREKGNVPKSADLSAAATLFASLLILWGLGPFTIERMLRATRYYFSDAHAVVTEHSDMQVLLVQALSFTAPIVIPLMLMLLVVGIVVNVAQFGFLFSSQALTPKIERLNPIAGFQKFVSLRSFVELVKSLSKLTIVGYVAWLTLRNRGPEVLSLMHVSVWDASIVVWDLLLLLWFRIALAMLAIGIFDFAYQRWQHGRDLMMTVQESRDEMKTLEGDPRIRQRVRQIQRQMAMQRMMAEVPEADVVITNPTTYAIALRYDIANMEAPTMVAKGMRRMAERIRDIAVESGVPIVERPELARGLYDAIDVGQPVPEDLFRAVAEVLAFVYEIDKREEKVRERSQFRTAAPVPG